MKLTTPSKSANPDAFALLKNEFLTHVAGEEVPVTVIVREPFESDDQRWICPAGIAGLFHRKADLIADTPIEAVEAAKSFIREELAAFVASGADLNTSDNQPLGKIHRLFRD